MASFKSKELKHDVRLGSRAFMFYSKRMLGGSTKTTRSSKRTTIENTNFAIATYHNGYVHFDVEVKSVSANKLAVANRILNSFAEFMNPRLRHRSKVSGTFSLEQQLDPQKVSMVKFFRTETLSKMSHATGLKLKPSGMWLTERQGKVVKSVVVTVYRTTCLVEGQFYTPLSDQIPNNILANNYKIPRNILDKTLFAVRML
jgi:hypothetical protein